MVPDFVVVGHLVRDLTPDGWRPGGTVTFAAAQARALRVRCGVVTRAAAGMDVTAVLPGVEVVAPPANGPADGGSDPGTVFENTYTDSGREQRIHSVGAPIDVADIPADWLAAPVALLGPVFGEVAAELAAAFSGPSLVGVSAQGWLRGADATGRVRHEAWRGAPYWRGADVLFASDEDLAGNEADLERWIAEVPIVAVTRSSRGARIFDQGALTELAAYPAVELDATGAGDTFATAFLLRLRETGSVLESARFGSAAASLSVEGVGVSSIGERAAILQRVAQERWSGGP